MVTPVGTTTAWQCGQQTSSTAAPARSAGRIFLTLDPGLDDVGGTADSRGYRDGRGGTIEGARPAFHTAVAIEQPGLFAVHFKYTMGTHDGAQAAPHAFFTVECQGGHIRQMSEFFHKDTFFVHGRDKASAPVRLIGVLSLNITYGP